MTLHTANNSVSVVIESVYFRNHIICVFKIDHRRIKQEVSRTHCLEDNAHTVTQSEHINIPIRNGFIKLIIRG